MIFSNFFIISFDSAAPPKNKVERRTFRPLNKDGEHDIFDYVYRTFELTSFDQLLREQEKLNKKVLQLNALNETLGQPNTFKRLFNKGVNNFES